MAYEKEREDSVGGVVAAVYSKTRLLLIIDSWLPDPKWKFPGGGIEKGETAKQAGAREVREETGLKHLKARQLRECLPPINGKHFVAAQVPEWILDTHGECGVDGEIPKVFTFAEVEQMPEFLELHRPLLEFTRARLAGKS